MSVYDQDEISTWLDSTFTLSHQPGSGLEISSSHNDPANMSTNNTTSSNNNTSSSNINSSSSMNKKVSDVILGIDIPKLERVNVRVKFQ
jgi:hypothetical protein